MRRSTFGLALLLGLTGCDSKKQEVYYDAPNLVLGKPTEVIYSEPTESVSSNQKESYKTLDDTFASDSDEVLLARMIFGECRNCDEHEMAAVAYTAINRANDGKKWNGSTVKEAILKKYQYSCFNQNDPNRVKLMDPEQYDSNSFLKCLHVSQHVLSGRISDPTSGATHYYNPQVCTPSWASSPQMTEIGHLENSNHIFYREN